MCLTNHNSMNPRITLLLAVVCLSGLSCMNNQEMLVESEDLIGVWNSEGMELKSLEDGEVVTRPFGTWMGIFEDGSYWRNYISGNWELMDNEIIFKVSPELSYPSYAFRVTEFSTNSITLEIETTEIIYGDFDEFRRDEKILLTEKFIRSDPEN